MKYDRQEGGVGLIVVSEANRGYRLRAESLEMARNLARVLYEYTLADDIVIVNVENNATVERYP